MSDEPKPLDALTPEEPPSQPETGETETPELFTPPPLDASPEPYTAPSPEEAKAPEAPFAPPDPPPTQAPSTIPTPPPQKKGLAWWVIVLIVLVVLCCCCVATGLIGWGLYRMLEEQGVVSNILPFIRLV